MTFTVSNLLTGSVPVRATDVPRELRPRTMESRGESRGSWRVRSVLCASATSLNSGVTKAKGFVVTGLA